MAKAEMNIQKIKLADLKPDPDNPRIIRGKQFNQLLESLKAHGQREILSVDQNMMLISGHQRFEAMKKLGFEEAWCDVINITEEERIALNISMNSDTLRGEWDREKLAEQLYKIRHLELYGKLGLQELEPLDLSNQGDTKVDGDEDFPSELLEENNYIIFTFNNAVDWQMVKDKFELKAIASLDSRPGYERKGIGRMVNGKKLIEIINDL